MIFQYIKKIRPAFFTRLSNLIILQILFLFVAFGLLFLFPVEEEVSSKNPIQFEKKFKHISLDLKDCLRGSGSSACNALLRSELDLMFKELDYVSANLFVLDSQQNVTILLKDNKNQLAGTEAFNLNFIKAELLKSDDHLLQTIPSTQKLMYYYTFEIDNNQKALLAIEFEHHYIVTSKDKVLYTFGLLFLGGVLVSLLTVYLINKRIREPLAHILNGLEKTTQGDLYYMVETNKDKELNKLTESFNHMSRTLWKKDQKLKQYNNKLLEINTNLVNSKEFLRKILDNSSVSIITTNTQGIIKVFNETASEHFAISIDKALGMHISELFTHEVDPTTFDNRSDLEVEVVCKKSDNTVFPAFVRVASLFDSDLQIVSYLYVIQDISESKSTHNVMIQMNRYFTKGEMAGDIAHEINNFLAILSGNIELMPLILKKNDPEKINAKLELMKKQVDRIVNFTDGLLEANDGDESFIQVDMNQLVMAVKSFLQPQNLFDYIEIKTNLSDNIPLVHTNIGQIRQLLVNLIYNSGEALVRMENEKFIEISTSLTGSETDGTVTIIVKDNGPGIASENIDYIFHKRFTTKPHGNGISLLACQKIIESHSGSISYSYENGAVFTIILPITQEIDSTVEQQNQKSESLFA